MFFIVIRIRALKKSDVRQAINTVIRIVVSQAEMLVECNRNSLWAAKCKDPTIRLLANRGAFVVSI
jgi:hypothetical protein